MSAHTLQRFRNKTLCNIFGYVKINLFLAERTPNLFCAAVRKLRLDIRRARLSLVDEIGLRLCRLAVFPEIFVADKHILVRRSVLIFQKITVKFRLSGNVVYHEIKHQIVIIAEPHNIIKAAEVLVHRIVSYRCKAPVGGRRIKRKYMYSADGFPVMLVYNFMQLAKVLSHTVGIGNQHYFVA